MAAVSPDYSPVEDLADPDLLCHPQTLSISLLRSELDGLRKQMKDDMKDMSSELAESHKDEIKAMSSKLSDLFERKIAETEGPRSGPHLFGGLSKSRSTEFCMVGTDSDLEVGSFAVSPAEHSPGGSGTKRPSMGMGPTRSERPAALDLMTRRVRTYQVAREVEKHNERVDALGDVAGSDGFQRNRKSLLRKNSTRSKGSVNIDGPLTDESSPEKSTTSSYFQRPAKPVRQGTVRFSDDVEGPAPDEKMIAVNSGTSVAITGTGKTLTSKAVKTTSSPWQDSVATNLPNAIGELHDEQRNAIANAIAELPRADDKPQGANRGGASSHSSYWKDRYIKPRINQEDEEIRAAKSQNSQAVKHFTTGSTGGELVGKTPTSAASVWTSFSWTGGPTSRLRHKLQNFVRRTEFDGVTGMLIVANAVSIGIQTDVAARSESGDYDRVGFQALEGFFCFAFTLELLLRIFAYGLKFFWMFGWRWNVFDCLVVSLQLLELLVTLILSITQDDKAGDFSFSWSILRLFRILRLIRIVRVVRVLRFISDLRTLVYSVFGTLRQFFWTVLMIGLLIYITGVQFTQIVVDWRSSLDLNEPGNIEKVEELEKHWGSLSVSVLSLFASVSGGVDWQVLVDPMIEHISPFLAVLFCAYISFGVFALLNVVTGIFVQSAMVAAKEDNQTYVVNQIRELFLHADTDESGVLSWDKFSGQLHTKEMKEYFKHLDIDIAEANGVFSLLDLNSDGEITADEFLNGSLHLRGSARALEMEVMMRAISESNEVVRKTNEVAEDMMNEVLHIQHGIQGLLHKQKQTTPMGSVTEPVMSSHD